MSRRLDLYAAGLSLLYPGLGQLSQNRRRLGWVHVAWATGAVVLLFLAPILRLPQVFVLVELALVTLWSVVDAALRSPTGVEPSPLRSS